MPAISYPSDPDREDYTATPWTDGNGTQWLWEATPGRWTPYTAPGVELTAENLPAHTHALADLTQGSGTNGQVATLVGGVWTAAAPSGGGSMDQAAITAAITNKATFAADNDLATEAQGTLAANAVPSVRTLGGVDLSANRTLSDIGAQPETAATIATALNAGTQDTDAADTDRLAVTTPAGGWMTLLTLWTWITTKLGALTSITAGGAWSFSSTTRPTSAGTTGTLGAADASSLITKGDGDARYAARYKSFSLNPRDFSSSLASGGAAASDRGSYSIIQAATASSKALIYADPYAKVFNATGVSYSTAAVFEFSLGLNDGVGIKAGSEFYVQFGRSIVTTTAAQLGSGSKGMGIKITSSGITPFVGNGSAITSGSTYAYSAAYIRFILEWVPAVGFNVYTATAAGVVTLLGSVTTGLPSGSFGAGSQLEFLVFDLGGATNAQYIFLGNLTIYLP